MMELPVENWFVNICWHLSALSPGFARCWQVTLFQMLLSLSPSVTICKMQT